MSGLIPFFAINSITFSARSASVVFQRIFRRIFMAMNTVSLRGFQCCKSSTSKNICFLRNCFQMFRINTNLIAAEVVKNKSIRNRTFNKFVTNTIRSFDFIFSPRNVKYSVAFSVLTCGPDPTRFCLLNLGPKVFHWASDNAYLLRSQT